MSAPIQGARLTVLIDPPAAPDDDVQYIGFAQPGTAQTDALWAILRLTRVGSDVAAVEWAEGTHLFVHVWADRATFTYA